MLDKIAKHHNLWLKMALDLGVGPMFREDVIQDMYIKMHEVLESGKDITYGEDGVNRFYIYLVIKSMSGQMSRKDNYKTDSLDDVLYRESGYTKEYSLIDDGDSIQDAEAFDKVYEKVMLTLKNIKDHPKYPKYLKEKVPNFMNLFLGYNCTDKTMRDISKETGVRLGTIHRTLHKVMEIIRSEVGVDVSNYFGKDYELIK